MSGGCVTPIHPHLLLSTVTTNRTTSLLYGYLTMHIIISVTVDDVLNMHVMFQVTVDSVLNVHMIFQVTMYWICTYIIFQVTLYDLLNMYVSFRWQWMMYWICMLSIFHVTFNDVVTVMKILFGGIQILGGWGRRMTVAIWYLRFSACTWTSNDELNGGCSLPIRQW